MLAALLAALLAVSLMACSTESRPAALGPPAPLQAPSGDGVGVDALPDPRAYRPPLKNPGGVNGSRPARPAGPPVAD